MKTAYSRPCGLLSLRFVLRRFTAAAAIFCATTIHPVPVAAVSTTTSAAVLPPGFDATAAESIAQDLVPFKPYLEQQRNRIHTHPEAPGHRTKDRPAFEHTIQVISEVFARLSTPIEVLKGNLGEGIPGPIVIASFTDGVKLRMAANDENADSSYSALPSSLLQYPRGVIVHADMSAQPVPENIVTNPKLRTEDSLWSHAAGNDATLAATFGAAMTLTRYRERGLQVPVHFVYTGFGGSTLSTVDVEEFTSVVLKPLGEVVIGTRWLPSAPTGSLNPAPVLAAAQGFNLTVTGKGGHGAMPINAIDPVLTLAAIIENLQVISSRDSLARGNFAPEMVRITSVHAGDAHNVIPHFAKASGMMFSSSLAGLGELRQRVEQIVEATSVAHQSSTATQWERPQESFRSDAVIVRELAGLLAGLTTAPMPPDPADFAFTLGDAIHPIDQTQLRAALFSVGTGSAIAVGGKSDTSLPVLTEEFLLDEVVLIPTAVFLNQAAAKLQAAVAAGRMSRHINDGGSTGLSQNKTSEEHVGSAKLKSERAKKAITATKASDTYKAGNDEL